MFKKQKEYRIINSFNNIYHLKKESNINVGITYLLLFIPLIIFFFLWLLNIFFIQVAVDLIPIIIITAFINIYRVAWTYKDSLRCLLTFLGVVICFFIFTLFFNNSPLSSAPANGFVDYYISLYQQYPEFFTFSDLVNQFAYLLSYNATLQTLVIGEIQNTLSLFYAHVIYVFIIRIFI